MAELARRPDWVDAYLDQMAREGVTQVVEPKLRHVFSDPTGRRRRVVEVALRDRCFG